MTLMSFLAHLLIALSVGVACAAGTFLGIAARTGRELRVLTTSTWRARSAGVTTRLLHHERLDHLEDLDESVDGFISAALHAAVWSAILGALAYGYAVMFL